LGDIEREDQEHGGLDGSYTVVEGKADQHSYEYERGKPVKMEKPREKGEENY